MKKRLIFIGVLSSILTFSQLKKGFEIRSDSTRIVVGETKSDGRAQYETGDKGLRKLINKEIDFEKFPEWKKLTCIVYCTITEKGEMEDIFSVSEDENFSLSVLNAFNKIKPNWSPAILNGKPAKSRIS